MSVHVYPGRPEKFAASAAALGAHLLFIILLVLGVSWHRPYVPPVNTVDLWAELPPAPRPAPAPAPPQVQPEPVPRVIATPAVRPPPKAEIAKADIALKEKAGKERRILEDKQQEAVKQREQVAKATAAKAAAKAAEEQRLREQQAAEAQRAREQQEAQEKLARERAAEQEKLAREQAAAQARQNAQNRVRSEYIDRIRAIIRRNIVMPPDLQGNPEAEFSVRVLSGGQIMNPRLTRSSGNSAYDAAVERAIIKTDTLPLPSDPVLAAEFRELNLKFRPKE